MKRLPIQFLGGLIFLLVGTFGRNMQQEAVPPGGFLAHPLAGEDGSFMVGFVSWMGVLGTLLILLGLGFVVRSTVLGFRSGAIQAYVKEKMPKRKAPEEEEEETPEED